MPAPLAAAKAAHSAWKLRKPLALLAGFAMVVLLLPALFLGFAATVVIGAQLTCNGEDTNPAVASRAEIERTARKQGIQPVGAAILGALFDAAQSAHPKATVDAAGPFRLSAGFAAGSPDSPGRWHGPQDPNGPHASSDSRNSVPASLRAVSRYLAAADPHTWTSLRHQPLEANPARIRDLATAAQSLLAAAFPASPVGVDQLIDAIGHAGAIDAGAYGDFVSGGVLLLGDPQRARALRTLMGSRAFGGAVDVHPTTARAARVTDGASRDLAAQQGLAIALTDDAPTPEQVADLQDATEASVLWVTKDAGAQLPVGVIHDDSPQFYATLGQLESLAGASAPGVLCDAVIASPPVMDPAQISAPDPFAHDAIAYAYAQIGKPYLDNGQATPPDSWDCSKLTSAAWAAVGVNLIPYSYRQYDQVQVIPETAVQPGDLAFWFRNGAHHVALVDTVSSIPGQAPRITFVEAANPSRGVVRTELSPGWYTDHLTGFGRVLRPATALTSHTATIRNP